MPFVANTPESLLDRSDSRNPNATCRGITSSGRLCRRPVVAVSPAALHPRGHSRARTPDPSDEKLYCWQHKEQAAFSAHSSPGPRATATPILEESKARTSLDTRADRLGLMELQEKGKRRKRNGETRNSASRRPKQNQNQKSQPKASLGFCFCFSVPIQEVTDAVPPPRPRPRPVQQPSAAPTEAQATQRKSNPHLSSSHNHSHNPSSGTNGSRSRLNASTVSPGKASYRSRKSTASQTARLKDLIPDTLDTTTASALMGELARPFVDSEEPGYIYMFWLTPASNTAAPPVDAARSLLSPPSSSLSPARNSRRASDVVSSFAGTTAAHKTMLLKIGRAANVQRRMNQWQRQCGKDIEVLRYYPYQSRSQSFTGSSGGGRPSSASAAPRMTPHCKRVERLVHIELAGLGLAAERDACGACGREHREWFEVEATRGAIRAVDDVIRRWIEWDLGND